MSPRWFVCCLALLIACRRQADQTGVVADITSELAVPAEIDHLRVVVTGVDSGARHSDEFPLSGSGAQRLPASMLVVPASGSDGRVRVEVSGLLGDTTVVTRSASLAFAAGKILHVALPLRKICAARSCPAGNTCGDDGACASDGVAGSAPQLGDGGTPDAVPVHDAASPSDLAVAPDDGPAPDVPAPTDGPLPADLAIAPDTTPVAPDIGGPEPSRCPAGAFVCDGFERPLFDSNNPWETYTDPDGLLAKTFVIDNTRARRGGASLRMHVDPGTDTVGGFFRTIGMHDTVYVRYFVFLHAAPPAGADLLFDGIADMLDTEWSQAQVDLDSTSLLVNPPQPSLGGFPTERWVCVTSMLDAASRKLSLALDDKVVLMGTMSRAPKTDRIHFRIEADLRGYAQGSDLWIDEVVASASPLTCAD